MENLQSNNEVAYSIWKRIFGKTPLLSAKSLLEFLHNVQGERDSDLTDAKDLIAILNHIEMPPDHALVDVTNKLDKARFVEYLLGPLNDAFDPSHQELPTRKLTKPLSHYWINSSHNTYLVSPDECKLVLETLHSRLMIDHILTTVSFLDRPVISSSPSLQLSLTYMLCDADANV